MCSSDLQTHKHTHTPPQRGPLHSASNTLPLCKYSAREQAPRPRFTRHTLHHNTHTHSAATHTLSTATHTFSAVTHILHHNTHILHHNTHILHHNTHSTTHTHTHTFSNATHTFSAVAHTLYRNTHSLCRNPHGSVQWVGATARGGRGQQCPGFTAPGWARLPPQLPSLQPGFRTEPGVRSGQGEREGLSRTQ